MLWNINTYVVVALLPLLVEIPLALFSWRRRYVPAALPLALLSLALVEWSLCYALELGSRQAEILYFFVRLEYIGISLVSPFFFLLAMRHAGSLTWTAPRRIALVLIIPTISILIVWTPLSTWMWRSLGVEQVGTRLFFAPSSYGWWFVVHTLYAYVLNAISTVVLMRALVRYPDVYRGQVASLLVAVSMPWIGNLLYLLGVNPFPRLDLTPFMFGISAVAMAFGIFRFRLIDMAPIASDAILKNMSDGVMVVDTKSQIVDINPVAASWLGYTPKELRGRFTQDAFTEWPQVLERFQQVDQGHFTFDVLDGDTTRFFEVRVSPLRVASLAPILGRVFIVRDITSEQHLRLELERANRFQQAVNDLLRILQGNESLEDALQRALDIILAIPWLQIKNQGGIFLSEGEPPHLRLVVQRNLDSAIQRMCQQIRYGQCLCGLAALKGEILYAEQVDERHEIRYHDMRPHGHYNVPIRSNERTLGVIVVYLPVGYISQPDEMDFFRVVAETLASIIERKRAEEIIRRHALTFASLSESVIITDLNGKIIDANPATEQMFGYSRTELLGQPADMWHHPDQRGEQNIEIRDALEKAGRWKGEIHFLRKDGTDGWAEIVVVPLKDVTGQWVATIGVSRDVTETRRTRLALENQKRLFENLVSVARAASAYPTLKVTLRNALDIVVQITGADRGSLFVLDTELRVTESILARGPVDDVEQARSVIGKVMDKGLAGWVCQHKQSALIQDARLDERWATLPDQPYEVRSALCLPIMLRKTLVGVLTLMSAIPGHFTDEHRHLMEAASDQIALALRNAQMYEEQYALALKLAEARDAAERSNRTKSIFLANMSHEFRTPLNAIIGYSELLQEELAESEATDLVDDAQRITFAGRQLLELVNDVLDVSKIEAGKMELYLETFNIASLIDGVLDIVKPLIAQKSNRLQVHLDSSLGDMTADQTKVRQILLNLLSNAAKFTEDGEINLRVTREPDGEICFEVQDSGIGISEKQLSRLFQPFTQADASTTRKYGGSGLGLTISKHFCEMMGGRIEVSSRPNEGSVFKAFLPQTVRTLPAESSSGE